MSNSSSIYRRGSSHPSVVTIRQDLIQNGYLNGNHSESIFFDRELERAVIYFQQTHNDEHGKPLEADGVVGEKTWWALEHGNAFEHGETELSPTPLDFKLGATAYGETSDTERKRLSVINKVGQELGAKEEPDGSNRGVMIDKFLPLYYRTSKPGPPWCAFFVSWGILNGLSGDDCGLGLPQASVRCLRLAAQDKHMFHLEGSGYDPIPGDVFIIAHKDGTGHTGFVLGNKSDTVILTIEGNCGNAVRSREMPRAKIFGYINLFADEKKVKLYVEKSGKSEEGKYGDR